MLWERARATDYRLGDYDWTLRKHKIYQEIVQHWNRWLRSSGISGGIENSARLFLGWGGLVLIVLLLAGDCLQSSGWTRLHLKVPSGPHYSTILWTHPWFELGQGRFDNTSPVRAAYLLESKIWSQTELVNLAVLFYWEKKDGKKVANIFFSESRMTFCSEMLLLFRTEQK